MAVFHVLLKILLTGLPVAQPGYKMTIIFFLKGAGGGGRGKFWEVAVGVHLPALLIFTLFQSNIYKVNVREYRPGIYVVKMNTITTL